MNRSISTSVAVTALLQACGGGGHPGVPPIEPRNAAPTAIAAAPAQVEAGLPVLLDGTASRDSDGDPLQYRWTLTARPSVSSISLGSSDSPESSLTPDALGRYAVVLVVNDGRQDSAPAALSIDVVAPENACVPQQALRRYMDGPPPGYSAPTVVGWASAMSATSQHIADVTTIDIDSMALVEQDTTTGATRSVPQGSENHDQPAQPYPNGALYPRSPKCQPGESDVPIADSVVADGVLHIDVEATPSAFAHWWGREVDAFPGKRYRIHARVKVTGRAALQFGVDWWRTRDASYTVYDEACEESNNCEAWVSDWIGDTAGQYVEVDLPNE